VAYVSVDPATGLRAVPGGAAVQEVFVAGTEPQEYAPLPDIEPVFPAGAEPQPTGLPPVPPVDAQPAAF